MVRSGNFIVALAKHEHHFVTYGVLAIGRDKHEKEDDSFDGVLAHVHARIAKQQGEYFADELFFSVEYKTSTGGCVTLKHSDKVA